MAKICAPRTAEKSEIFDQSTEQSERRPKPRSSGTPSDRRRFRPRRSTATRDNAPIERKHANSTRLSREGIPCAAAAADLFVHFSSETKKRSSHAIGSQGARTRPQLRATVPPA